MKTLSMGAALAALLLAPTPSLAQTDLGPPPAETMEPLPAEAGQAGGEVETRTTAAGQPAIPVDTPTFVRTVISSDLFEIRSSEIVRDAPMSGDVQALARQMIEDHTESSREFMEALERSDADPPPTGPEMLPHHQEMLQRLQAPSGRELELVYLELQLDAHMEAVSLFRGYAEQGDDPVLVEFAREKLPSLQQHADLVEGMYRTRGG
jgi:putative membrane protein